MRWLAAAILLAFGVLSGGCPASNAEALLAEDWEDCSPSCGWVAEGEMDVVSTIHGAEHGMLLEAGTEVSKAYDVDVPPDACLSMELVTTCAARALDMTLTWGDESGAEADQAVALRDDCSLEGGADLDAPYLTPCADLEDGRPEGFARIVRLSIRAGARCIVDRLVVSRSHWRTCG